MIANMQKYTLQIDGKENSKTSEYYRWLFLFFQLSNISKIFIMNIYCFDNGNIPKSKEGIN